MPQSEYVLVGAAGASLAAVIANFILTTACPPSSSRCRGARLRLHAAEKINEHARSERAPTVYGIAKSGRGLAKHVRVCLGRQRFTPAGVTGARDVPR